jgi:catechol 2,3-dioxygenase-like lactoylglutathione lyase family enzyme
MPPVTGLLETALYVDDPQRSAAFYESLFGFTPMLVTERLISMRVREGQVLLLFKKGASLNIQTPHDGDGQLHLAFAISADDVEKWREALRERNIPIEEEIQWPRGGTSLYFRDPDGHALEVGTPGIWENY